MKRVAFLLVLTSCGVKEEDFPAAYTESYCGWAADCGFYATYEDCEAEYADWDGPPDGAGDYDASMAKQCIKALDELACPVDDPAAAYPVECSQVYP